MIIRIMGEGQFTIPEDTIDALNVLDERLEEAVEGHDEPGFRAILAEMLDVVRAHGEPLPDDELAHSDAVLPPPDASAAELRVLLQEEGLIPG